MTTTNTAKDKKKGKGKGNKPKPFPYNTPAECGVLEFRVPQCRQQ